ncbi:hypothetical protein POM88_020692 [Heracleum sosnowskyi]|uniref:Uncharacterized protein n=1 Tax=Heracleum sosnowskyi TaxID=360622 RepID=A0AAD8IBV8_9APIA|nr:hypothetical protein POM88_020692 [Heracleum sosnowskyi]
MKIGLLSQTRHGVSTSLPWRLTFNRLGSIGPVVFTFFTDTITCEQSNSSPNQEFQTTLSYVVDVEPKLWLPVRLVEGRLCREISINLSSIGKEAQRTYANTLSTL